VSLALLACSAIGSTLAWAAVHIRLESSVPEAGEVLATAPERFELRFSGPVNEALSSLVLVAPSGDSVHVAVGAPGEDDRILVGDVPELTAGEYLVLWRTVSADGHPVSGEFGFTFAGAAADAGVPAVEPDVPSMEPGGGTADGGQPEARLVESAETDEPSSETGPPAGIVLLAGFGMVCLLGFAGLLWYCGSLPLLHEPRIGRATTVLGWAALLFLGAQYLAWILSVLPAGAGITGVTAALGSSTGVAGLIRLALISTALIALPGRGRTAATLALTAVVVGGMSGHAAAISPWVTMPAKVIHLGAASIWFGGLLLLVVAPDGPKDGSDAWHFDSVVRAVSAAALLSVVLIAASGMVQSSRFVGEFAAYTGTTYGRGVLLKWAGLLSLMGFGAYHRFRVMPHLEEDGPGGGKLHRTVLLETAVMLAVVMVATWLARVSPPTGH